MKPVEIRKVRWKSAIRQETSKESIVIYLETDDWSDFGYHTLFHAHVSDHNGLTSVGDVKIVFAEPRDVDVGLRTADHIDSSVPSLDRTRFASLGQSVDYYNWFASHPQGAALLRALADLCVDVSRGSRWEAYEGFKQSVIRFSDAKKALEEGHSRLSDGRSAAADMSFSYRVSLPAADAPHEIDFRFTAPKEKQPARRINVLIGPNGVGKSSLLHLLASDLSPADLDPIKFPRQPTRRFSRQILVSTSPFDIPKRPESGSHSSYRFIGLRWQFESLRAEINAVLDDARDGHEVETWDKWLATRLPSPEALLSILSAEIMEPPPEHLAALSDDRQDWSMVLDGVIDESQRQRLLSSPASEFPRLSAGQQAIVTILAGLAAELDDESLVLIDEPENHLHPRFLSLFLLGLSRMLDNRRSFAVVSTHSTFVLQSVPAECVHVVSRRGNKPRVRPLIVQSFGASLTALSLDVFHVDGQNALWVEVLREMLRQRLSVQEILDCFEPALEPEVETYLRSEAEEG